MESEAIFYKIINELCEEKGISQNMYSFNWIRQLKKGDKTRNIIRYQFDLNSANSFRIAGDKYATYALLSNNNIPILEHRMIFNPDTREDYFNPVQIDNAIDLLKSNDKVIIKANQSAKGRHVFLCENELEIRNTIDFLLKERKDTLSACPYIDIEYEYRAIYLNGEILYIYKKEKPYVIGNDKLTVNELINDKYGFNSKFDYNRELNLDLVPGNNEKIIISWKHNLCNGASPIVIEENDKYYNKVKDMATLSAKIININFATIDIALTKSNELKVVEINASVCMDKFAQVVPGGYQIAKDIYSKAIDAMFY